VTGIAVVIEDDAAIGALVLAYLEQAGFDVVCETTGENGLDAVERHDPRVVVLDLALPDLDGLEVCRRLRASRRVPILILTARDEEVDRIVGLELGADDYMTKPFSPRELVARVRAILRRAEPEEEPEESTLIELGDVQLDRRLRRVAVAGSTVALRTLEFELLAELAENAGQVVTRDRLLERVWGVAFAGGTRTVDVHVAQLRKKLARPDLIETVRGVGYRAREGRLTPEA
jgi:DNA-binding response OmpR family regulator